MKKNPEVCNAFSYNLGHLKYPDKYQVSMEIRLRENENCSKTKTI